ncbi:MAG: helix-turn-helix transcriptional regulator [Opitutales bacterium]|nr:helix-turn-helix transcriptional regulator [Opitutales bacterium]
MNSENQNWIPNLIRQYRFENGEMTQQVLADTVGVSRQTIISLEAGRYNPSLMLAYRIARAFDLFIEDVFMLEDVEKKRS